MTMQTFLVLFMILSTISGLVTEFIKKWAENIEKNPSANLIAIVDGVVVGGLGTTVAYVFMGIQMDTISILAIPCMMIAVAMGSMLGFDKIKQLLLQIENGNN